MLQLDLSTSRRWELVGIPEQLESGGFTRHVVTGHDPETGYMVSIHEDRGVEIPEAEITARALREYIEANADLLTRPDRYLGGWLHEGTIYLDVSVRTETLEEALALASKHDQQAVWGLSECREYFVENVPIVA